MTGTNEMHEFHQHAINAGDTLGEQVLHMRCGPLAVSIPLHETSDKKVNMAEAVISGGDVVDAANLLLMVCSAIVVSLIPEGQREALEKSIQEEKGISQNTST